MGEKFNGGEFVQKFEMLWSKKFKVKYSVSVNSNTTVIYCTRAIGISPGDEVIVPPISMSATVITLLYGAILFFRY